MKKTHSHCPCDRCNGKAVSRSTEFRHWQQSTLVAAESHSSPIDGSPMSATCSAAACEMDESNQHIENASVSDCDSVMHSECQEEETEDTSGLAEETEDVAGMPRPGADIATATPEDVFTSDITKAVFKAFQLLEDTSGSHKNLTDILEYGRDLYCKGNQDLITQWPTTWSSCLSILQNAGYKEPKDYYICLNKCHPNQWSCLTSPSLLCQYCQLPGEIKYHYLCLADKVIRWCSSESFCEKMTAHWRNRKDWINGYIGDSLKEIWDGYKFAELSWFWDPEQQWLLPVRCKFCSAVVSADEISSVIQSSATSEDHVLLECSHCFTRFVHHPQYTYGDPRNIALIGHWDGWQPFSSTIKHSCGES